MPRFEIRDPIHTRIPFDAVERRIIDHPFVQRLRFIGQLSFLQTYVYPGGVHSRFSHSLGAMHVAGRLFGRLMSTAPELTRQFSADELESLRRRMRFAGLLHDIGHGPFSHATERAFPGLKDLPLNRTWWKQMPDRQAAHEDYSVLLIQTLSEKNILPEPLAQDIAFLIHKDILPSDWFRLLESKAPTLPAVMRSLVSGEIDCDRMDYLLRDSYFCGVAYGKYDIDWLISSLGLTKKDGRFIVTLNENGVRAFEDMLLSRYHMIDQVYYHKTKAGFAHCLEQAIKTGEVPLTIPTDPHAYAKLRDDVVLGRLFEAAEHEQNYWANHLMQRVPAKHVLRLPHTPEGEHQLKELERICRQHDIGHFTYALTNTMSDIRKRADSLIHVAKKSLGNVELIPVFDYSSLLKKYNERLEFTDFFVLREDYKKFSAL